MDIRKRAREVLRIEAEAIRDLESRLDENFGKAVEMMLGCTGRVVVMGMGKAGLVGRKIAHTLASTGQPALFLHPAEAVHGDLGMVVSGDVMLVISNSGETREITGLVPILKKIRIPLIVMTGNPRSTLGKAGEAILDVGVKQEACPLGLVPTASTTGTLAMGDALAVCLIH